MAFKLFLCSLGIRFLNVHRPWVRVGRVLVIPTPVSACQYGRICDSPIHPVPLVVTPATAPQLALTRWPF